MRLCVVLYVILILIEARFGIFNLRDLFQNFGVRCLPCMHVSILYQQDADQVKFEELDNDEKILSQILKDLHPNQGPSRRMSIAELFSRFAEMQMQRDMMLTPFLVPWAFCLPSSHFFSPISSLTFLFTSKLKLILCRSLFFLFHCWSKTL